DALVRFASLCPNLNYLAVSLEQAEDRHLFELAKYVKNLLHLEIQADSHISQEAIEHFVKANPKIDTLLVNGEPFARLEDRLKSPLHTENGGGTPIQESRLAAEGLLP